MEANFPPEFNSNSSRRHKLNKVFRVTVLKNYWWVSLIRIRVWGKLFKVVDLWNPALKFTFIQKLWGSSYFVLDTANLSFSLVSNSTMILTPRFHVLRKGHRKWHEDNALCYPPHAMFLLTDAHFSFSFSLSLQLCKSTWTVSLLPKLHNLPRSQGEVLWEPSLEDPSGISVCLLGEWCMKPAKTHSFRR